MDNNLDAKLRELVFSMRKESGNVRHERTGQRDGEAVDYYSMLHRCMDYNCALTDLDRIFLEFDTGLPVALTEIKHCTASPENLTERSLNGLRTVADRTEIPLWLVLHDDAALHYYVLPGNEIARSAKPEIAAYYDRWITIAEYMTLLLAIRSREPRPGHVQALERMIEEMQAVGLPSPETDRVRKNIDGFKRLLGLAEPRPIIAVSTGQVLLRTKAMLETQSATVGAKETTGSRPTPPIAIPRFAPIRRLYAPQPIRKTRDDGENTRH